MSKLNESDLSKVSGGVFKSDSLKPKKGEFFDELPQEKPDDLNDKTIYTCVWCHATFTTAEKYLAHRENCAVHPSK